MAVTLKQPRRHFIAWSLLFLLLLGGAIVTNRQAIYDWLKLRGYSPPATIAQLASDDTMTDKARRIYYVNHPQLENRTVFSNHCPSGTEQSVVLGCYQSNQDGIYLLNVSTAELAGIEQVTAAHETLHAAYDRLSSAKRVQVDVMLQNYYDHQLTDTTIKQTIQSYKKTEPDQLVNEMHSIIGSEVANLPAPLETYYKQYFTDRSKVTGYYTRYQAAFSSRQNQIKQDDAQLASWKTQISSLETSVSAQQSDLKTRRAQLDAQKNSGDRAGYSGGVANYNQAANSYNDAVDNVRQLISRYNQLVGDRNMQALEEQQLVEAITSQPASGQ